MKKISYYIFAALMCATSLSSCSDMLAEESAVEVDKSKYMNNASEAETVLLGVYRNMVTDALYSYNLSILFNITNDIAQCEGNSTNAFREIPANAFTTSNSSVQSTWSTLYNSIYNANDFIETLESKWVTIRRRQEAGKHLYGRSKSFAWFILLRISSLVW